jgi:geranylgeranyl diphosphate synthase type 3
VLILECCLRLFAFCLLQYSRDKGYCEDLTEGKFSFPIIHAIMSHPDDNQVIRILLLFHICSLADTLDHNSQLTAVLHLFASSYIIQLNLKLFSNTHKKKSWFIYV